MHFFSTSGFSHIICSSRLLERSLWFAVIPQYLLHTILLITPLHIQNIIKSGKKNPHKISDIRLKIGKKKKMGIFYQHYRFSYLNYFSKEESNTFILTTACREDNLDFRLIDVGSQTRI